MEGSFVSRRNNYNGNRNKLTFMQGFRAYKILSHTCSPNFHSFLRQVVFPKPKFKEFKWLYLLRIVGNKSGTHLLFSETKVHAVLKYFQTYVLKITNELVRYLHSSFINNNHCLHFLTLHGFWNIFTSIILISQTHGEVDQAEITIFIPQI